MPDRQRPVETYANHYYTGTQATIWVGNTWIDECTGIQIQATQNMIPIYGYASVFFDMMARGRALVQGAFEINFIDEGYLYAALLDAQERQASLEPEPRTRVDIVEEQLERLREYNSIADEYTGRGADRIRNRRDIHASVLNELAQMTVAEADQLLSNQVREREPSPNLNAIYRAVPFKLTGYMGNPNVYGKQYGAYKEINNCFLVSNELIIGSNDDIIAERYSFIARSHI